MELKRKPVSQPSGAMVESVSKENWHKREKLSGPLGHQYISMACLFKVGVEKQVMVRYIFVVFLKPHIEIIMNDGAKVLLFQ